MTISRENRILRPTRGRATKTKTTSRIATEIKVPDGSKIEITESEISNSKSQITDSKGGHGWPVDAPPQAIAPFDAEQANKHQEAWAKYLGVPVEYINSLGMKFRLIPPGEFMMGSTQEEIGQIFKRFSEDTFLQ